MDHLRVRIDGRVATVTMNRPASRNALDGGLVDALAQAFASLGNDNDIGCIVLTGSGGSFCSGADLKEAFTDPTVIERLPARLDRFHDIIRGVVRANQPVIAAVDGAAVGFGCDLALACDIRLVSEGAYFQEKFVRIGLIPDGGGTMWLPQLIGIGRAMEAILTGDPIDARRADALGLCNRVVPAERLLDEAHALAERIAAGPPLANAGIKRAVRAGLAGSIEQTLGEEREAQLRCLQSNDFLEGTMAWLQKRDPRFTGT